MHPDPLLRPASGRVAKLLGEALFDQRSIPPRAYREQRLADRKAIAIARDSELPNLGDPARDLLAFRAAIVEVVVAGAEDDARLAGEHRKIFFHHDDLGTKIHH